MLKMSDFINIFFRINLFLHFFGFAYLDQVLGLMLNDIVNRKAGIYCQI